MRTLSRLLNNSPAHQPAGCTIAFQSPVTRLQSILIIGSVPADEPSQGYSKGYLLTSFP
jgi:hypothetical protein